MKNLHLVATPTSTQTLCGKVRINLDREQAWSTVTNYENLVSEHLLGEYQACPQCVLAKDKEGV